MRVVVLGGGSTGEHFVGALIDNFGIPLEVFAKSAFGTPTRMLAVDGADTFQVSHDLGQVFEASPEAIEIGGWPLDVFTSADTSFEPLGPAPGRPQFFSEPYP